MQNSDRQQQKRSTEDGPVGSVALHVHVTCSSDRRGQGRLAASWLGAVEILGGGLLQPEYTP